MLQLAAARRVPQQDPRRGWCSSSGARLDRSSMLKASPADSRQMLANFDEVEHFARALPCMHSMLLAHEHTIFPLDACSRELEARQYSSKLDGELEAARVGRRRIELNGSECSGALLPGS